MRAAVCLSGEMRGDPHCLDMLKQRVVEPLKRAGASVDLFCHTRRDDWWRPACDLDFRCLWVEENRQRDATPIFSKHNPPDQGDREPRHDGDRRAFLYQSYLQQYYSLQACATMVERAAEQDHRLYDLIVRTRPDVYLTEELPVADLDRSVVSCPWNDWWPYEVDGKRVETVNDRFAIGPYNAMMTYLRKRAWLMQFCSEYRLQGEWFTAWQMNVNGIKWVRHDKITCKQSENLYKYSERP